MTTLITAAKETNFAHVVQHKQDGNIVKHLEQLKLIV